METNAGSPHKKRKTNDRFTDKEDATLSALVYRLGTKDWEKIASYFPLRNARQCKERWTQYLSPDINKQPFSKEEDQLLIQKQQELGSKWEILTLFFKGRTSVSLRNRWKSLTKNKRVLQNQSTSKIKKKSPLSELNIDNLLSRSITKKVNLPPIPNNSKFKIIKVVVNDV